MHSNEDLARNKITLKMWFKNLRHSSQVALIIALIAAVGGIAVAATNLLWNSASNKTTLTKEKYVEVSLSGTSASGSVRPGSTVSLSPMLTNNGDVDATAIIVVTVPVVNGSPAYDYEVDPSWTLIDPDPAAGVFVYGYGSEGELSIVPPGESTTALTSAFTMKSSITGAQFNSMSSVDIEINGYLADPGVCREV